MNYYQITPDIDLEDDRSSTSSSPLNMPTSDEDDDPNWLVLSSSKFQRPSSGTNNLQKQHNNEKASLSELDNSLGQDKFSKAVMRQKVDKEKILSNLIDNSARKEELPSTMQNPSTLGNENNNAQKDNLDFQKHNVVLRKKNMGNRNELSLDLQNNHESLKDANIQVCRTTSPNNNGSFDENVGTSSDKPNHRSRNINRLSKIWDGVASYAAGYINTNDTSQEEYEEEIEPPSHLISDKNDNIFTQSLHEKLHDINMDYRYANNNYNSFTQTYTSVQNEVPPLILCDLSPEENNGYQKEDEITKRIDDLFDSLKPLEESASVERATHHDNEMEMQQFSEPFVRRRQKLENKGTAYNKNYRKSFGEGLVDISTRKLQTMSGYFGDWTKWLKTAEEEVNEENEFHRKLNVGQPNTTESYEAHTNFEGRKKGGKINHTTILSSKSVLKNPADVECQKKQSAYKNG